MRLKICDSHLTCKVANKCLNVRERVEVVEWNKMIPSLPLLSCELSVSVEENPDRKKNICTLRTNWKFCIFFSNRAFIWYWVLIFGTGLPLFMIYDSQFPSCEHTQYVGPLNETSTAINLGFHCQVQDYLGLFFRLSFIDLGVLSLPVVFW